MSQNGRSGAELRASSMPELPVRSAASSAEEIFRGEPYSGLRKRGLDSGGNRWCGSNPSVGCADSSLYTREPNSAVSLRSTAPKTVPVFWTAPLVGAGVPDGPCWTRSEGGKAGNLKQPRKIYCHSEPRSGEESREQNSKATEYGIHHSAQDDRWGLGPLHTLRLNTG